MYVTTLNLFLFYYVDVNGREERLQIGGSRNAFLKYFLCNTLEMLKSLSCPM